MAVTLISCFPRPLLFHLHHGSYCKKAGQCQCSKSIVRVVERHPSTGIGSQRARVLSAPAVVTLLPGERREGLHEAITELAEIQNAVRWGWIRVVPSAKPDSKPESRASRRGSKKSVQAH
ncbi:MAG: hypothetical protein MJE77_01670 [Proteobacteria bacterium]|nr:hypothetical protein [Pseudomonadota bacterium]